MIRALSRQFETGIPVRSGLHPWFRLCFTSLVASINFLPSLRSIDDKYSMTTKMATIRHSIHPLVRDLYKRVLIVGRDYPTSMEHVKQVWKQALRNPNNCPSCYFEGVANAIQEQSQGEKGQAQQEQCEEELIHAVARGRHMVKEMMGIIQLKKYRAMRSRYGGRSGSQVLPSGSVSAELLQSPSGDDDPDISLEEAMVKLEKNQFSSR